MENSVKKNIELIKIDLDNHINKKNISTVLNNVGKNNRFLELDLLKGIAVILMIVFHFYYMMKMTGSGNPNIYSGILKTFARISHTTFITVIGINLSISFQKWQQTMKDKMTFYKRQLFRSFKLMIAGLAITAATKQAFPEKYVRFGIFHFMSIAIIFSMFLMKFRFAIAIIGIIIAVIYQYLKNRHELVEPFCTDNPMTCFVTGIANVKYNSMDHFSLLRWLPLVCLGITIGNVFYKNNERQFKIFDNINSIKENPIIKGLEWLGKRSFGIYFIHFILFYIYFKTIN